MMGEWRIRRRDERCASCGRGFEEGERHYSLLLLGEEGLGREDRCPPCFEGWQQRPDELVFWRTRRPPAAETGRALAVDFDAIEQLFFALEGRRGERLEELRYLLSLLLLRKKRLKLARVRRTGAAELLVLRRPRRQEAHEVRVFDLQPERLGALRAELERIFEGAGAEDLAVPAGTAGAADETSADDEAPSAAETDQR